MSTKSPGGRSLRGLAGFALLLVVVFAVAFAAGREAGPVSPGLVPGSGGGTPGTGGHHLGMGAAR